ncbi:hypothetical protein PGT21_032287 [Puccinia graminis f. sp. tritici]|uniref:Uncharacterized protein n=1 Tax=Puccinia graminis f. sp. tritici TaxID=56615 RepID=A0A5B0R524_PUCGR|nr:hypothetical protein PGT21_032287 [Puccinia graminis f. sp. tritici]KAA1120600.1 hypothetical protein PGTUg99_006635 [Puccinia graminis f. sp. tritici]
MATSASPLPSGPLRFATSTADSSRPHTFALRYPSSHPAGLSNAGASLSSTASGDVSLRQGASEPCGRRWAGQPTKTTDIECAVVWDENQHCWILHRLDNIVHLRNDDPGPLQKKPTAKLTTQLALPKPALSAPPPPKVELSTINNPHNLSKPNPKDILPPKPQFPNPPHSTASSSSPSPPQASHPEFNQSNGSSNSKFPPAPSTVPPSSEASQPRHNSSDASTSSSSNITRSQDRDHNNRTRYTDDRSNRSTTTTTTTHTHTTSPQVNLVLPTKKRDYSAYSSQNPQSHNPPAHRPFNQSNLITTSPASDTGPLRVAQAEEVEEFDFDSPADPDPPQPDLGAPSPLSPLKLPSPASHQPPTHSYQARPHLGNLAPAATSPAGRPTLSRSPSVADNGVSSASLARPNANPPLILPSRPSNSRPKAVSPAYPYNGLPRSANLSNQPTAPSPLASIAYSSSSSPEDRVPTATTPALLSVSPASVTVTTTESVPSHGGPTRRFPVPSSNGINGRSGISSPIPTWQYTQHLQQPHGKGGSPLGVNGNRSPAALTSQNLTTVSSSSSVPQRPYQRSDSGSSVRESDTDSDDDGEGSSEDEEGFDPVPAPPQPTEPPPPQVVEPLRDSEQDAEAEEDDEDDEFELTNIATELEASMMIGAYYGPEVGQGAYGAAPATTEASQAAPAPKPTKSRKKTANTNPKGNATTRKAGASKAKSKAKA